MERIATYSISKEASAKSAAVLKERFWKHLGKYGVFTFVCGSHDESRFREFTRQANIPTYRRQFTRVLGREIAAVPFFYLSVQEDREYGRPEYTDTTRVCSGDESTLCRLGAEQSHKVLVDPSRSKRCDIMLDGMRLKPLVIIITKALKELLASVPASGCKYVPCLQPGRDYSDEECLFNSRAPKLEVEATHFQLVVTGRPFGPPSFGEINRIIQQCSRCGALYRWDASDDVHFQAGDLPAVDFALYDRIRDEGGREYELAPEVCMISSRILQLFLKERIKGLRPYLVDPDVRYGVVEIREETHGEPS